MDHSHPERARPAAAKPDWLTVLADLLTIARTQDCGCDTCITLRAMWPHLRLDDNFPDGAPQVVRPDTVCPSCWGSDTLQHVRAGGASIVTVRGDNTRRCVMCGLALAKPPV